MRRLLTSKPPKAFGLATPPTLLATAAQYTQYQIGAVLLTRQGPVAELVGIEGGVVSGVFNLEII